VLISAGYVGSQTKNIIGFVPLNEAGLASPEAPIHGETTNTLANLTSRVPFVGFTPGVDGIGAFMNTYCVSEQACVASPYTGASLRGFANQVVNGWSLSGVIIGEPGLPFNITDSRGGTIVGLGSFAQFAPGKGPADVPADNPTIARYFNTNVFALPPALGNGTY